MREKATYSNTSKKMIIINDNTSSNHIVELIGAAFVNVVCSDRIYEITKEIEKESKTRREKKRKYAKKYTYILFML